MKLNFFLFFLFLLIIEIFIAIYIKDNFIRPFVGDILVVILIYYFTKSFFDFNKMKLIIGIFIFSCLIEFLQYLDIVKIIGFQDNKFISIIIGRSFSWLDIFCYFMGCLIIYLITNNNYNFYYRKNRENQ